MTQCLWGENVGGRTLEEGEEEVEGRKQKTATQQKIEKHPTHARDAARDEQLRHGPPRVGRVDGAGVAFERSRKQSRRVASGTSCVRKAAKACEAGGFSSAGVGARVGHTTRRVQALWGNCMQPVHLYTALPTPTRSARRPWRAAGRAPPASAAAAAARAPTAARAAR